MFFGDIQIKPTGFDKKYYAHYYTADKSTGNIVFGTTPEIVRNKLQRIAKKQEIYSRPQQQLEQLQFKLNPTVDIFPF